MKHRDPMLLPLRDPAKRADELRLLKEFEASGKIKRVDEAKEQVDMGDEEEATFEERQHNLNREAVGSFGDGNFRRFPRRYE